VHEKSPIEDKTVMDVTQILNILPHRYPFILVDRIIELIPLQRIVGIKNVTINEPFFVGHFPARPIMPGVLILEAMAQTGGLMLAQSEGDLAGKVVYFTGIDKAKFRKPVVPGDQLRLEIELLKYRHSIGKMRGKAFVDGQLVCEADLAAAVTDQ